MRITAAFILLFSIGLYSQTGKARLEEEEVKGSGEVNFENRTFNRASEKVKKEHEQIGEILSEKLLQNPDAEHTYKGFSVRRYSGGKDGLFGADILYINDDTSFGHVHSVIRVLSSYVEKTFDFSKEHSDTVALYILYYNVMHRNEKSYFMKKYSKDAVTELDTSRVGISSSYREWPGKTQIVIPIAFSKVPGKPEEVKIEELEKEVNKIIDTKKDGPAEKEKMKEIVIEKKKEEEKVIDLVPKKEITKIPEKEIPAKVIEKKLEPVKEEKIIAKTEPVKEPLKEIKTEPVKEIKTEPVKTEMARIEPDKPVAEKTVPLSEVKEIKKELETLKTEKKEKEEKSDNVVGDKILFLRLVKYEDDGHYTNELWQLDGNTGESLYRSPYTNICGKEFHVVPGAGIVVLGFDGKQPKERAHKLILLDEEKLSQKKATKEEIFWRSHIIIRDNKIYAFEKFNNAVYFSRFNNDLSLDARSSEPVNTSSEVSFFKEKIFLTGKSNESDETTIRVIQRSDLKVLKSLKPMEGKRK